MQALMDLTSIRHAARPNGEILNPRSAKNIARQGSLRSKEYSTAATIQANKAGRGIFGKEVRCRRKYAL